MNFEKLIKTRIVIEREYAFLPTDEIHDSSIPNLREATVKVLATPHLGAGFVEYLLHLKPHGGTIQPIQREGIEQFIYTLNGSGKLDTKEGHYEMSLGDYAYLPPNEPLSFEAAEEGMNLILVKKRYESYQSEKPVFIFGNERDVEKIYENGYSWQHLIPLDKKNDMKMSIGNFPPGIGFDFVETHFEEHGMYILSGKGVYLLGKEWYPYQKGDFVWMAPFCPQSVYPVGKETTRYLIYKNWFRDIKL